MVNANFLCAIELVKFVVSPLRNLEINDNRKFCEKYLVLSDFLSRTKLYFIATTMGNRLRADIVALEMASGVTSECLVQTSSCHNRQAPTLG